MTESWMTNLPGPIKDQFDKMNAAEKQLQELKTRTDRIRRETDEAAADQIRITALYRKELQTLLDMVIEARQVKQA